MKWWALALLGACATPPRPVPVRPTVSPQAVTPPVVDRRAPPIAVAKAFVAAAGASRFDEVLELLAKPLRARYSVASLTRDFGVEPLAEERLAGISKRLAESPEFFELRGAASLEWAPGRSLRLVFETEADAWRIAALE